MKYRKKPVVVEATRWFRNGDHPLDGCARNHNHQDDDEACEGKIVRRFNHPDIHGGTACPECGNRMREHGWIDTLEGGHRACPGDWIITGIQGEHYPCKPDIFDATYEAVEEVTS